MAAQKKGGPTPADIAAMADRDLRLRTRIDEASKDRPLMVCDDGRLWLEVFNMPEARNRARPSPVKWFGPW